MIPNPIRNVTINRIVSNLSLNTLAPIIVYSILFLYHIIIFKFSIILHKIYKTGNHNSNNIVSECDSKLKKYLEVRGIDNNTLLTSPMTGHTFSIEWLVTTLDGLGMAHNLVRSLDILPLRNDKQLLVRYLSGVGDIYLVRNAM